MPPTLGVTSDGPSSLLEQVMPIFSGTCTLGLRATL